MKKQCYLKLKNNADEICYINTEHIREIVLTHDKSGPRLAICFNDDELYNISIKRCPERLTERLLENIIYNIAAKTKLAIDVDWEIDYLVDIEDLLVDKSHDRL